MVSWSRSDFFRIFSALIVPLHPDESVNYDALAPFVERQLCDGVEGFYCCGSSGEALLLSLEERKRIVETVVKQVRGRVPVVAHVGTIRTRDAIVLARHAADCGCAAVSMIPPYYYKFSMAEIASYYEEVMAAVPELPMILYNIPQFTGIEFSKANAARLLENPGIIGIKHTSTNLYSMERMATACPDKILFNGFDEQYLGALSMGAEATIGTTVNLFAPLFLGIREAFRQGQMCDAHLLQQDLNRRVEELVAVGVFPATKYGCTVLGIDCGPCRHPFSGLTEKDKQAVEETVRRPYPETLHRYLSGGAENA